MGEPETITTINPGEEHWSTSLVGDNPERAEDLRQYETPQAMLEAFEKAQDWRRGIAGDDDKYYSDLQRFKSPLDYGNSYREAQQKIRSGNLQAPPGPDATPDDIAAYRDANGIPQDPAGYFKGLPEGLVVGEEDMSIFEDFAGSMHEMNVKPEVMHKVVEWYNGFAEEQQAIQAEVDSDHSAETTQQLREEWGPDYRANINLVKGLLSTFMGKEAGDQLLNGRYGDGKAFMNDPNVLKGLAEIARKVNPIAELGYQDSDPQQSLNEEIAQLEKYMREKRTEYNKDEKAQARLRYLYEKRIEIGAKA